MKLQNYGKAFVLAFAFLLMSHTSTYALTPINYAFQGSALESANFANLTPIDYSFKVTNKSKNDIKKILVSEDGQKYGYFDIGNGIGAGRSATLVWDKSTDNGYCEWYFKAVFDDDAESEPVKFDFCEKELELVFD